MTTQAPLDQCPIDQDDVDIRLVAVIIELLILDQLVMSRQLETTADHIRQGQVLPFLVLDRGHVDGGQLIAGFLTEGLEPGA